MRRCPRLNGFDYSTPAAYFITIVTYRRAELFGTLAPDGSIDLNQAGRMIEYWWDKMPQIFAAVTPDARCIMPDHLHGLLLVNCGGNGEPTSLSKVVQWFKSITSVEYFRGVRQQGWAAVDQHVWQRSFCDRIIRNECEFHRIRRYIESNPGALYERTPG